MKCPTCGKPVERKGNSFRPFCSERCKMVDLGRWVNEEYRVSGKPIPSDSAEAPDAPKDSTETTDS
ncbi:MAG: DNA gyrase inhibitor YacG [Pyrinomonadaceae bacterium]|nr:DNA gyrase inhibitor YacG [Pyrinomonadaceae bacterium]